MKEVCVIAVIRFDTIPRNEDTETIQQFHDRVKDELVERLGLQGAQIELIRA